jgi:hypothetical protein
MAELNDRDKVKLALDEARMLILGAQILLGFEYRTFLEPGMDELPRPWHYVKLMGLVLILLTNCLLMWPATFQQLSERGEATEPVDRFATRIMCWALLPFAMAMGIDFSITFAKFGGTGSGLAAGATATASALFFWYLLGYWRRGIDGRRDGGKSKAARESHDERRRVMFEQPDGPDGPGEPCPSRESHDENVEGTGGQESDGGERGEGGGTPLKDKINDVLTEGRVILPGAQAVLGFQLIVMLSAGFDQLPRGSQYVHLVSLALMALSTMLLMTAPAYHRIVEKGECTPHFFRFSSRLLMASMVPLAAGMAGDFFVVAWKVTRSAGWSAAAAAVLLAMFYGAWFGYTLYRRSKNKARERARPPREWAQAVPQEGRRGTPV